MSTHLPTFRTGSDVSFACAGHCRALQGHWTRLLRTTSTIRGVAEGASGLGKDSHGANTTQHCCPLHHHFGGARLITKFPIHIFSPKASQVCQNGLCNFTCSQPGAGCNDDDINRTQRRHRARGPQFRTPARPKETSEQEENKI